MAKTPRHSAEVRRFQRAASHRLEEARYLHRGGYSTAAVYLAGYAVECSLKALLLSSIPATQQSAVVRGFRGVKGHDFDWLKQELRRRQVVLPRDVAEGLARVNSWTTNLRYSPKVVASRDALAFLTATEHIAAWSNDRL